MSNLVEFAKAELERIGKDNDGMQDMMNKDILEIIETFSKQGHSGFSASYALSIIKRLLDWKPITPLTGEEDEWVNVYGDTYQNKRCPDVFREGTDNSTAYYIHGKVFSDDGGDTWYTSIESRVPVKFPFTVPDKPEYVIVENRKCVMFLPEKEREK